jgi:hypothetical protein
MVGKSIESECLRRERQSGVKLTKRGLRYGTPERPTTHKQQPPPSARQEVFCQATWAFNQGRYARNGHNVNNDGYCIEPDLLTARPPATRKRARGVVVVVLVVPPASYRAPRRVVCVTSVSPRSARMERTETARLAIAHAA